MCHCRGIWGWLTDLLRRIWGHEQPAPAPKRSRGFSMHGLEDRQHLAGFIPSASVNDVTVVEGNGGTFAQFTVNLSHLSTIPVSVNYSTVSNTATAGQDYTPVNGALVFRVGQTSQTVNVPITGDLLAEQDETFFLDLTGAVSATIGRGRGVGTILDDDRPAVAVAARVANTAEGSAAPGVFRIVRSGGDISQPLIVGYTLKGSAANGVDYNRLKGSVKIPAGKSYVNLVIAPINDTTPEGNENVILTLKAGPYTIGAKKSATITIADREMTPPTATAAFTPMANPWKFRVIYTDNKQMDPSTVGAGDVRITGPNSYNELATFLSKKVSKDGKTVVAYYQIPPAGGAWDVLDNGTYTVSMETNQVKDAAGNSAISGALGTFDVTVA